MEFNTVFFIAATVLVGLLVKWLLQPTKLTAGSTGGGPIRVTRIFVHPIKSCKPMSVKEWKYGITGLQYDRAWAVIDVESSNIVTARTSPKMVLVSSTIDEANNELVVEFPKDSGLPSFAVPLNPTDEQMEGYNGLEHALHFGQDLFPVLIPHALPSHSTDRTPSDLFSAYLGKDVRFVMQGFGKRPLLKFEPRDGDLEYDGVGETRFADGYPFLLVTEESYNDVKAAVTSALQPNPPPEYSNIGRLDPSLWEGRSLQLERFRPNVVVGGASQPFAEETWRKVLFEGVDGVKKGGMIIVSRCGRCLLPNVDVETGKADPALPFKVISKYRRVDPDMRSTPCFGVNGAPTRTHGTISVGDLMRVIELNDWEKLDGKGKALS